MQTQSERLRATSFDFQVWVKVAMAPSRSPRHQKDLDQLTAPGQPSNSGTEWPGKHRQAPASTCEPVAMFWLRDVESLITGSTYRIEIGAAFRDKV